MKDRTEYQNWRALVNEDSLDWISALPSHLVPLLVSIYEYEQEFADIEDTRYLTEWRLKLMKTYVSGGGGRGRTDLVRVLAGREDELPHRDSGRLPRPRGLKDAKNEAKREVKRGVEGSTD